MACQYWRLSIDSSVVVAMRAVGMAVGYLIFGRSANFLHLQAQS